MINYNEIYGEAISNPVQANRSFSFREKRPYESVPEGAKILSKNVSVDVREIDNGYIKCTNTEIHYSIQEGDDVNDRWCYNSDEFYYSEKPMDIIKMYL